MQLIKLFFQDISKLFQKELINIIKKERSSQEMIAQKELRFRWIKFQRVCLYLNLISNTRRDLPDVISTLKYLKKVAKGFDKVNTETRVATDRTFWNDFEKLAKSFGVGTIGYTHIEPKYIFKGFSVFYQSVIILGMEMKFEKIQKSPQREAGEEAMRIYSELGKANYELAKYMREQGVNAQSIHPFLGPALYPVLARKAGMGEIGANGLLITPQFMRSPARSEVSGLMEQR